MLWSQSCSGSQSIFYAFAGVSSVSIMWGPWALGMANNTMVARFERIGLQPFNPKSGMVLLETALASKTAELVAATIIWKRIAQDAIFRTSIFADVQGQEQVDALANGFKVSAAKCPKISLNRTIIHVATMTSFQSILPPSICSFPGKSRWTHEGKYPHINYRNYPDLYRTPRPKRHGAISDAYSMTPATAIAS